MEQSHTFFNMEVVLQTTQGNMLQSLRAVQAFLDQNAEQLDGVVKTGARKQLDNAIATLSAHVSDQSGSHLAAQGATQKQRALREVLLRDHMAPIARIARADLPPIPAVEPLKMPAGRPTAERLAAAAYGMAKAAVPFTSTFVDAGLPPDFVAQLTAASDAMLAAIDERVQSRGKRGGATKGLKDRLVAGRKVVGVLDAFVRSALKDNPALLANWNLVKRVQKNPGRSTPNAPTPSPIPGPAPAPAPAAAPSSTPAAADPSPPAAS